MIDPTSVRRHYYAAIHAAAKSAGLDEDTRRDLIERETGHRSAKDCDEPQLAQVLRAINDGRSFRRSSKPEVRKIYALWGELKRQGKLDSPTKAALRSFCARMAQTGGATIDPEFLTVAQARTVIEALKAWTERKPKETHENA